jgi:hypothetical protein
VSHGLVLPGDTAQIEGGYVPQANVLEPGLDPGGDQRGVPHLCESGDDDVALARPLHGPFQLFFVDGQVYH